MRFYEILAETTIESPAFKAWFAGSKVVTAGKPMLMFHGTKATFTEFHSGSHFGTVRAANQRIKDRAEVGHPQIHPVYLAIKHPLKVTDMIASDESALMNAIARGMYPLLDVGIARQQGAYVAAQQAGYDGLVYQNHIEDRGKRSWVVFHPSQVRSVFAD